MASRSAIFPTHPRPTIAVHSGGVPRRLPSLPIPTASLPRRKPVHVSAPSVGGTLILDSFVKRKNFRYSVASASTVETPPAASDQEFRDALERCFAASPDPGPSSSASGAVLLSTMKKEYGAHGAVTLEKSKLDLSQKTVKSSPELATGGGGGDIGKKNFHGGGDGGDDDGDDDDYFDDFDDGEEGDEGGWFRRRIVIEEFFDRKFVDAVFSEWYKSLADLPSGLRQACEMGLVSSAQLVRFLSINARPTTSRLISRALSPSLSRAFIGRMIADPSFLYKLLFEQVATIGSTLWWELKSRKGKIREEWDLALMNVMTAAACNAFVVWSLAPCRSYGSSFRFDLQNTIEKLPNNIFEKSYPMRQFDLPKRIHSFFYKAAQFCMVGLIAGSIQGSLTKVNSTKKEGRLSVIVPSVRNNALGLGAFLGIYANLRYQLLCGIDRALIDHFDVLGVTMFFSTVLRVMNVHIGESSKLAWLGIEANPLAHSDNLLKPYSSSSQPSPTWLISKDALISGLGLLGLGQKPEHSDGGAPLKPRRKRVIKKKMSTSTM